MEGGFVVFVVVIALIRVLFHLEGRERAYRNGTRRVRVPVQTDYSFDEGVRDLAYALEMGPDAVRPRDPDPADIALQDVHVRAGLLTRLTTMCGLCARLFGDRVNSAGLR